MSKFDLENTLATLDRAAADKKITADSVQMIRRWLTEPRYAEYAAEVASQIAAGKWKELDDAFWTIIPFGTGGRRGKMYPVGSNAINDRTIGESAQGVADYVKSGWQRSPCPLGEGRGEGAGNTAKTCSMGGSWRAPSPTTRAITRDILPSCVPRLWSRRVSRFFFSMGFAARRSCRLRCGTRIRLAALWSRPATIRRATTR